MGFNEWEFQGVRIRFVGELPRRAIAQFFRHVALVYEKLGLLPSSLNHDLDRGCELRIDGDPQFGLKGKVVSDALVVAATEIGDEEESAMDNILDTVLQKQEDIKDGVLPDTRHWERIELAKSGFIPNELVEFSVQRSWVMDEVAIDLRSAKMAIDEEKQFNEWQPGDLLYWFDSGVLNTTTLVGSVRGLVKIRGGQILSTPHIVYVGTT